MRLSRHTHRNVMNHRKYGQIINCGLTILTVSLFFPCRLRITTLLRSGAVDKMAVIFTKHIWQPYICLPNELERKIRKKTGGGKRGAKQKSGGSWPTQAPLRIATDSRGRFYALWVDFVIYQIWGAISVSRGAIEYTQILN